jgi:hypothetical protein
MKRSTNLSYTKKARSYMTDTALFLRDLGLTDDGIKAVITQMRTGKDLLPDEPCGHPGCLSHVTHPCEGCGRIAGRYPEKQS